MRLWSNRKLSAVVGTVIASSALVTAMTFPGVASASTASPSVTTGTYLALGDSVAFGYVPSNAEPPPNYADPTSFVGYPEDLAKALNLTVANASCPGESTMSFLAEGAQSNGCENSIDPVSSTGYRTLFPLHVNYTGTQMAYAINYLKRNPATQLVTINIGANDAFICEDTTSDGCVSEFPSLLAQISDNLSSIYQQLRDVAGYQGTIVGLTYYSTTYTDPLMVLETQALDRTIAGVTKKFGGVVANGFEAFKVASSKFGGDPCAAGLLIKLPGGTCNIHPSPLGHLLLAVAIAKAIGD